MAIEALLVRYGLLAIFLGAGLEGEAVVVTGGILAHRHIVPLWGAAATAAAGSCLIDQLWFVIGRRFRAHRWVRAIRARPAFARALGILERHPDSYIFGFRFIYGLRTVSPIAIGTSRIPARRFVPLNMLAAAIWGPAFTLLGYYLGVAAEHLLGRMRVVGYVALAVAALVVVTLVVRGIARDRLGPEGG